jgi:hypothetical protein
MACPRPLLSYPDADQETSLTLTTTSVSAACNAIRIDEAGEFASFRHRIAVASRIAKSFDAACAAFETP